MGLYCFLLSVAFFQSTGPMTAMGFAPTRHSTNQPGLGLGQPLEMNRHVTPSLLPSVFRANKRFQSPQRGGQSPAHPHASFGSRLRSSVSTSAVFGNIELAGLFFDDTSLAFDAWEWTANIGAPAALVAGAVLVTLSETREDLAPRKKDLGWVRTLKQSMRFLLLTSFALEVVSIFVGTMTGSVLLGHGTSAAKKIGYQAPLQLLQHHLEFEYLTTQICFLQGLLHWLGAVESSFLLQLSFAFSMVVGLEVTSRGSWSSISLAHGRLIRPNRKDEAPLVCSD